MGYSSVNLAQSYIHMQGTVNYWQHSELWGLGIGFGYTKKLKKVSIFIGYDFGYGSTDRQKRFDNLNYDNWSTVYTRTKDWDRYLPQDFPLIELEATSDYGKQHQLTLQLKKMIGKLNGRDLQLGIGGYLSIIEQFFTITNIEIYNFDMLIYNGPLNYMPVTTRRTLTYGLSSELSYDVLAKKNHYIVFLNLGLGPNYGSYLSTGIRVATSLKYKD